MRIVLLGAPGSGKGTQAKRIAETYKIPHVPLNDLVRAAVADDTPLGRQIRAAMEARQPITDDMLLGVIQERLSQPDTKAGFILDGFPRNIAQAEALDAMAESIGQSLEAAVVIDVDFETLLERFTGRRTCVSCGRTYNIYTSPSRLDDRCDECGGNLRHRADDKEETISNRLRVYEAQTVPVLEYYRKRGILHTVQGGGEIDEIFEEIKAVLDSLAVVEKSEETQEPKEPTDHQPLATPPRKKAASGAGSVVRAAKVALAAAEEVASTIAEAVPTAGKRTVGTAKKVAKAAGKGAKSVVEVTNSQKGKAASTAKKGLTKTSQESAGAKKSVPAAKRPAPKKTASKKAAAKKAAPKATPKVAPKAVPKKAVSAPKKAASKKPAAKKPSVKAVAVKAAASKKGAARSAAAARETTKRVTKQSTVKSTSVRKAPAKKKTASGKASAKRR
ncbi:MAG: adenylate kinase [Gammaproteobacteria bacterium]